MKNVFLLCLFAIAMVSSNTVYCEVVKVAATTTVIEKAVNAMLGETATNAATISPQLNHSDFIHGYHVEILALDEIHWADDETFYSVGYKALLNKEVEEILAPPDNR